MIIGIAGRYSADTEEEQAANLAALNEAAARLLQKGHIPLIGLNAALPVVQNAAVTDRYSAIMDISMAVINGCEALLLLSESPGANQERDLILAKGLPVYYSLHDVPDVPE